MRVEVVSMRLLKTITCLFPVRLTNKPTNKLLNNKKNRLAFIILLLSTLLTQFQNCSEVSFSPLPRELSSNTSADTAAPPSQSTIKVYTVQHTFSSSQKRALDVVWVVDNSGSMSTEADHVRKNLVNFVNTIANAADLKFALISQIGNSETAVDYPEIGVPNLKLNFFVSSENALMLLSMAICPVGSSNEFCIKNSTKPLLYSKLYSFLRPDSEKVVVIVTDDESSMPQTEFVDIFSSIYNKQDLTLYGWIGLNENDSPCQAKTGLTYKNLAAETGGTVFNVCDTDWTNHFNLLAQSVVMLLSNTVPLPSGELLSATIIRVQLNGTVISPDQYSLSDKGIVFSPAAIAGMTSATMSIEYN